MSGRKEALGALLAEVEAGAASDNLWPIMTGHLSGAKQIYAMRAYKGSLDAAKALHDAVSPVINQYSIVTDPTCGKVSVCWWPEGLSVGREVHTESWFQENPARAWLIAIIKALIVEEDNES